MFASLRALLTGLIDYAGLFPPAGLPLDQAIRNYARYQQEPESWMLGRFICPTKHLDVLAPFVEELFDSRRRLPFAALGTPAEMVNELETVRRFQQRLDSLVVGDAFECRLPAGKSIESVLEWKYRKLMFFFEPLFDDHSRGAIEEAILMLDVVTLDSTKPPVLGLKLRCGGLHASAFPTPEQVALTIAACRDAKIPLKFTAGLHHPIRHFSAEVQTHMHGFINVFVAGVLAHARGLSEEQLRPIIEDEDASDFRFADERLSWKDYHASTKEIVLARQSAVTSFGSCSFDEPRDDLRKLGWLP